MLDRIINWVKSLFHEETPEEQDKRIHETIKSWKENADKLKIDSINTYLELCRYERLTYPLREGQDEVSPRHLKLWNSPFPHLENKDKELEALRSWHAAHLLLADIYCFDVSYPPEDPRFGQITDHVDIRPANWLKDLANEDKLIKALQMKDNAKQYQV